MRSSDGHSRRPEAGVLSRLFPCCCSIDVSPKLHENSDTRNDRLGVEHKLLLRCTGAMCSSSAFAESLPRGCKGWCGWSTSCCCAVPPGTIQLAGDVCSGYRLASGPLQI